ncbi:glycosyl hydrolase family 95 catalytic domain-containing protein [Planotetraspora sp. GP83]|uniref:glycosyl hydrolase family 95 catalytic domain-containing protein n=1 Tax=Planotetraspora sp. GP83 TaxID=3156264 RepID=UPI003517F04C
MDDGNCPTDDHSADKYPADKYPLSRRTVIGMAVGGAAVAVLSPRAPAAAATASRASGLPAQVLAGVPLDNRMATDTQWADFLRGQDLIWKRLPTVWHEGPFLGDGRLGSMVYKEPNQNQVRFTVQHGEVQDHRPQFGSGWGTARLPVGHLTLQPVGTISSVNWRLDLWNAELVGTITTSSGTLTLQVSIHDQVFVASVTPSGSEKVKWVFTPEKAITPRSASEAPPTGYTENPAWTTKTTGDVKQVIQPLTGGGQTATAYREIAGPSSGQRLLYLSVAHSYPATTAEATSLNRVQTASAVPYDTYLGTHRSWWHDFYKKSFLSIPDQRLQAFHWIQLYKVASATRAGAPVMATTGPWLEPTPWPGVWWNLNVQLEYWLIHGSNHLELDSVTSTLADNKQQLINNVGSAYRSDSAGVGRSSDMFANRSVGAPGSGAEVGDLTWALHNVWLSYRHTMDDTMLRDTLFPLLRRAINYYLHFLTTGSDGKLHLPSTFSPEYPVTPSGDTNYDLALIRWGCQTLLDSAVRLGIADPLENKWRQVLSTLTPYPTDSNGFMIGAGTPYDQSHRHYSHLLMIYPLYLVNWDQPQNWALIEKSIVRWHALTGAQRGYSYTGAGSMYAMMGRGDTALSYLMKFFDPATSFPCRANTHYTEAGPVIETPLSASQTIHDMLCQSWGGVIRVFPGVPTAWKDVTLHDFRVQGAFLVSAVRSGGVTKFVRLRSLAGEPLRLKHGLAVSTSSDVYQAENATISQGILETLHTGFTGTGYVNLDNIVGSYLEFTVNAATAGPVNLRLRFANGTTANRPTAIAVNGTTVATPDFPPTVNWDTWQTVSIPATLNAGANKIRATSTTANGGPNLDSLEVEPQSATTSYQAESATISQGVVESNHLGFTGTGFVNLDNVTGSSIEFTVNVAATTRATFTFRYANGTTVERPMAITVNGMNAGTILFPGTANWDTWQTLSFTDTLTAGTNLIKATSTTANGGPNLDRLDVTPQQQDSTLTVTLDDGSPATWRDTGGGVIEIDLAKNREVLVYPAGSTPPLTIAPVPISQPGAAWGLPT